jgi:hypothetical protein
VNTLAWFVAEEGALLALKAATAGECWWVADDALLVLGQEPASWDGVAAAMLLLADGEGAPASAKVPAASCWLACTYKT